MICSLGKFRWRIYKGTFWAFLDTEVCYVLCIAILLRMIMQVEGSLDQTMVEFSFFVLGKQDMQVEGNFE